MRNLHIEGFFEIGPFLTKDLKITLDNKLGTRKFEDFIPPSLSIGLDMRILKYEDLRWPNITLICCQTFKRPKHTKRQWSKPKENQGNEFQGCGNPPLSRAPQVTSKWGNAVGKRKLHERDGNKLRVIEKRK